MKLDVSELEDLAFDLGVSFLPYLAFYRGVKQVDSLTTTKPDKALAKIEDFGQATDDQLLLPQPPRPPVPVVVDKGGSSKLPTFPILSRLNSTRPIKIFVAGDRSKVGKSR